MPGAIRVTFWGALAMSVTAAVGSLVGTTHWHFPVWLSRSPGRAPKPVGVQTLTEHGVKLEGRRERRAV